MYIISLATNKIFGNNNNIVSVCLEDILSMRTFSKKNHEKIRISKTFCHFVLLQMVVLLYGITLLTISDESGTFTKTNSLHVWIFACLLILFYFPEIFRSLIPSEFQSVWIQIRSDILSGLIWVQTVCRRQKSSTTG